jgi:uncharacterized membrane protein YfcA
MTFEFLAGSAAVVAGAIASIAGFGIGSILTPIVAIQTGTKVAVAVVSIPHFFGTALRLWAIRKDVDRRILTGFGIASAAGGLAGALLHIWLQSAVLGYLLGVLLVFAAIVELGGFGSRLRFSGRGAWLAGCVSGIFGGLVGNQGGIRSAALLGFGKLSREAFVATATAIGLMVDTARMPVYAITEASQIASVYRLVLLLTLGVLAGTILGRRLLRRIPEKVFRRVVALLILALGLSMFVSTR